MRKKSKRSHGDSDPGHSSGGLKISFVLSAAESIGSIKWQSLA